MENNHNKVQGYCLKCKDKKELFNGKILTNKKGNKFIQGNCACGCKVNKFLKKDDKIDVDLPEDKNS